MLAPPDRQSIGDLAGEESTAGATLEQRIKAQAYGLGFDLVGITTLGPATTASRFDEWLARGHAGEMAYLERGAEKRLGQARPGRPGDARAGLGDIVE